jgi:hypothetical protein
MAVFMRRLLYAVLKVPFTVFMDTVDYLEDRFKEKG